MCHRGIVRVSYSTKILISTSLTKPVSRTHESYNIKRLRYIVNYIVNYIEPFFNSLLLMCVNRKQVQSYVVATYR